MLPLGLVLDGELRGMLVLGNSGGQRVAGFGMKYLWRSRTVTTPVGTFLEDDVRGMWGLKQNPWLAAHYNVASTPYREAVTSINRAHSHHTS